ncbi:MAG: O-antigen ligase family protein [Chloroflexota bacterium]|nr:O-antigen ligase family protein [Chloroflexota bacterium]
MKTSIRGSAIGNGLWGKALIFVLFPVTGLCIGGVLGRLSLYTLGAAIGITIMLLLLVLRQDVVAATLIIVTHIYVDWYLGSLVAAQVMTFLMLLVYFMARSPRHPWAEPRALWLWVLFLFLGIDPAIQGASRLYDIAFYYPNLIGGALLMFWLGTVIAKDVRHLRTFFQCLALLAALLAIHTIIQTMTGKVIFGSPRFDAYIASRGGFALFNGLNVFRVGSFFEDPNWNGTFFATMLFLPLGLFMEASSIKGKMLYLAEVLLMIPALLFTYSGGAWVGVLGGLIAFLILLGRLRDRLWLSSLVGLVAVIGRVFFSTQISLQLQHGTSPAEFPLRLGAWETGLKVIGAFPLTGVGLGFEVYQQRAEPYRVAAQYLQLDHPHNSYIEFGAKGGLPLLVVFLALIVLALWQTWRTRALLPVGTRLLLSGGIAAIMAFSVNSFSINAWTLPPLAALGWIILGAMSSPLLKKSLASNSNEPE